MKLRVARKMVEVALDGADKGTRTVVEGIHRMLECATEQRLARIDEVKSDARLVADLKEVLDHAYLVFAIARP